MMQSEEADDLKREMAIFFHSFRTECQQLTEQMDQKLQASLAEQRQSLIRSAQQSITHGVKDGVNDYERCLKKSSEQLSDQIYRLNPLLNEIRRKHQILLMTWMGVALCMTLVAVAAAYTAYILRAEISEYKTELELIRLINKADVAQCGDRLCAAVSTQKYNDKYYYVKQR